MYSLKLSLDNQTGCRQSQQNNLAVLFIILVLLSGQGVAAEEIYGPENLLKTLPTPFSTPLSDGKTSSDRDNFPLTPLAITPEAKPLSHLSLSERFNAPRLFLPERMRIGQSSEFLIKAKPDLYAAIAMAEKNCGAKPIFGHQLRLGPDRRLVAVGIIPSSGLLSLYIEAPIQGDLVDQLLYFEAVVWSKPDFSDLQIATPISPEKTGKASNAVTIAGQTEPKKGGLFVFDQHRPMSLQDHPGGLDTGRP